MDAFLVERNVQMGLETGGDARFRVRRTSSSSDRFLGVFTRFWPETSIPGVAGDELSEDDVFWTSDFAQHNHSSGTPSTSTSFPNRNHLHNHHGKGIVLEENFGILAALPPAESEKIRSVFNHKVSASSSSSSSRMIPMIQKKSPLDPRGSRKYYQSAPLNVPVMTAAIRRSRSIRQSEDINDDHDDEGDGEMLPPHEVVASRKSPMVACSVLEGVGRTLKGRDLRQVRNSVWRKTGFLD